MGKALIGFLIVVTVLAGSANSTDVGMITSIEGGTTLTVYDGNGVMHEARNGDRIYEHDKFVTRTNQTAILQLNEKSEIVIAPLSEFTIDKYVAGRTQTTILTLAYGMIRSLVKRVYTENEAYVVQTRNSVMGVRGTNFVVEVDKETGETTLSTLRGKVAIAANMAALRDVARTVMVPAGQKSTMQNGMATASAPTTFNKTQLHEHLQKNAPDFEKNLGPEAQNLNDALHGNTVNSGSSGDGDSSRRFDRQGGTISQNGPGGKNSGGSGKDYGGSGKDNGGSGKDNGGPGKDGFASTKDDDPDNNGSGKGSGKGLGNNGDNSGGNKGSNNTGASTGNTPGIGSGTPGSNSKIAPPTIAPPIINLPKGITTPTIAPISLPKAPTLAPPPKLGK